MKPTEIFTLDCRIGIKALQNLTGSYLALDKLLTMQPGYDPILVSSVFQHAVVRYAKPFLNSSKETGSKKYPLRPFKNVSGYSNDLHKHLLHLRNTLVAHDDFEEITTRILIWGVKFDDEDYLAPVSASISNKCLSFPKVPSDLAAIHLHVKSCVETVHKKLLEDLRSLRNAGVVDQEYFRESAYQNKIAPVTSGAPLPEYHPFEDVWLNNIEPTYTSVNGYEYEHMKIEQQFLGEQLVTPMGRVIDLPTKLPDMPN